MISIEGEWQITFSEEVEDWYKSLGNKERLQTETALKRLAIHGTFLRMPHNRHIVGKLWELRFPCGDVHQRITYTTAPEQKLITLTTFRKQRQNERNEISRARKAMRKHQNKKG